MAEDATNPATTTEEDPLPPSSLPLDETTAADPAAEAAAVNKMIFQIFAGVAALLILNRLLK